MSESLYPTYSHTRDDSPASPCTECKRIQDKVETHLAIMNLESCLEIGAALCVAWYDGASHGRSQMGPSRVTGHHAWTPGCGWPMAGRV